MANPIQVSNGMVLYDDGTSQPVGSDQALAQMMSGGPPDMSQTFKMEAAPASDAAQAAIAPSAAGPMPAPAPTPTPTVGTTAAATQAAAAPTADLSAGAPPPAANVPPAQAAASPGGMQKTETKTEQKSIDPESEKGIKNSTAKVLKAANKLADASGKEAEAKQVASELEATKSAEELNTILTGKAVQQRTITDRLEELDKHYEELSNRKIDPARLFKGGEGVFNGIVAALAISAGTFAAGATGSDNIAFKIIDRTIDRDLEAQKVEAESQRSAMEGRRNNLMEIARQTNLRTDDAMLLSKATIQKQVAQKYREIAGNATSDIARQRVLESAARLDSESQMNLAKLKDKTSIEISANQSSLTGKVDEKTATQIRETQNALKHLDDFETFMNNPEQGGKISRGFFADMKRKGGAKVGALTPEESQVMAMVQNLAFAKATAETGQQRTEKEVAQIKETLPNYLQSLSSSKAVIATERQNLQSKLKLLQKSATNPAALLTGQTVGQGTNFSQYAVKK